MATDRNNSFAESKTLRTDFWAKNPSLSNEWRHVNDLRKLKSAEQSKLQEARLPRHYKDFAK